MLNEFYTLQMLGLVTTKSNLMVAILFPKVNYKVNSKTQVQAGASIGSVRKFIIGASRMWSPNVMFGFQSHYCCHQKLLNTNFMMEEKLTPQLTMTAGLQITNKPSFLHE